MSSKNNPAEITNNDILKIFDNLKDKDKFEKSTKSEPQTVDEIANKWQINNKIMNLFADKIGEDTKLKSRYARWLIIILAIQLGVLNLWFLLKGIGIINFANSTFNIFITGGIAEVFLLVRVIVKYLFSDNLSELLKLVIRTSNMNNNDKFNKNKQNKK